MFYEVFLSLVRLEYLHTVQTASQKCKIYCGSHNIVCQGHFSSLCNINACVVCQCFQYVITFVYLKEAIIEQSLNYCFKMFNNM